MAQIKQLVGVYEALKVSSDTIHQDKMAFVELFKGTGSMSSHTHHFRSIKHVITLDKEASFEPTFVTDILDANAGSPFITKMDELVRDGYFIIMHASPPCNAFSRMNTTGSKNDDVISDAMKLVEKAVLLMEKYSVMWCLENPATGSLWTQDFSKEKFVFTHDVDYCVYGGELKKNTRFVFSSFVAHELFTPRTCPGAASCAGGMINPETNRFAHLSWDRVSYHNRIAIPKQLCLNLLQAMVEASKQVIPMLKQELIDRSTAGPSYTSPSSKRKRSSTTAAEKWMIEQGDVVVFASSDEFLKMTSQNISACDQYELPDCKLFLRAFYVEHFDVTTIDCDDVFVFKGKHYCGTFPNMVLAKDSSFIAVKRARCFAPFLLTTRRRKTLRSQLAKSIRSSMKCLT